MKVDLINSLSYKEQERILEELTEETIKQLLSEMDPDDLVDFIQSVSSDVRNLYGKTCLMMLKRISLSIKI